MEWGINPSQGAVFDLFNQMASWAQATIIDGVTYYWVSREKVVEELPLYCTKADTVYRYFKDFAEKGLIKYLKQGNQDLISITEKGATWNSTSSEMNPTVGNKSEQTRKPIRKSSEMNPTYKSINNNINKDQDNPLNPPAGETQSESVLDYLNDRLDKLSADIGQKLPKFKAVSTTLKDIKARITESSVDDCKLVIDYLVAKWGRDDKMREYICPKTIFRKSNFADYLPKSTAWAESGRPVAVNGKWVNEAEAAAKSNLNVSVDEVRNVYQRYLSTPTLFNRTDFSDLRKKFVYHCVIKTKNAKPTESNINAVIAGAIKLVAEEINNLPTPNLGI